MRKKMSRRRRKRIIKSAVKAFSITLGITFVVVFAMILIGKNVADNRIEKNIADHGETESDIRNEYFGSDLYAGEVAVEHENDDSSQNVSNNEEAFVSMNGTGDNYTGPEEGNVTDIEYIDKLLSEMSLHDKICQMFIITPEALTGTDQVTAAGSATKEALSSYPVGGLVYFSKNLSSVEQTKKMLGNTMDYSKELTGLPILLCVDEEGGKVARCAEKLGVQKLSPMFEYRDEENEKAWENAKIIADYLKELGFNTDFAPVADTWSNPDNTVIGKRAYSDDFQKTAELIPLAVRGFHDGEIICSLKHFPGHGDTETDSHTGTACTDKTIDQLEEEEYRSFESGINAGADMVMVGHITVSSVSGEPATVCYDIVTGELRNKLGFDGVIITDGLNMGAVADKYSSGPLAVKCILAGNDILLMPADFKSAVSEVENAVKNGEIPEDRIDESVRRIIKLKMNLT